MTEDHFDAKKAAEKEEDEDLGKKENPQSKQVEEMVEDDVASTRGPPVKSTTRKSK